MDDPLRQYVDELVRQAGNAGRALRGTDPIDVSPMAYVAGALFALERTGALTAHERQEALWRCHDAFGLERPPAPPPGTTGVAMAYRPAWRRTPPPSG